jgi:hypothetical protein
MTATATHTIRIYCKAKEVTGDYEADVVPDLAITELIAGLNEDSFLPALAAGERWHVIHVPTSNELPPNATLAQHEVKDGDHLNFERASHGAAGVAR